jgi:DNA-binding MarR family transcriptional regulator
MRRSSLLSEIEGLLDKQKCVYILLFVKSQSAYRERIQNLAGSCPFNSIRRASRAVTSAYGQYFDKLPITAAQCPLLTKLYLGGPQTITVLAEFLALDRTTLARNMKLLEIQAFVAITSGADARERIVTLTERGQQVLLEVLPFWEEAHAAVTAKLGDDHKAILHNLLVHTVSVLN